MVHEVPNVEGLFITPAIKYNHHRHSGEGRNPGLVWMPDQACPGHDPGYGMTALAYLIAGLIGKIETILKPKGQVFIVEPP